MRHNMEAARAIVEGRTDAYSAALWAEVPLTEGPTGRYVTFPGIVGAAIMGREAALAPARNDVRRRAPSDLEVVAVEVLAAWFLDYNYFRFSVGRLPVALLFGNDPVDVSPEASARLAVAAAQFLCGYEEEDAGKRAASTPLAVLAIKESMWGSPLPEEWI
jgi:hypothetical protein